MNPSSISKLSLKELAELLKACGYVDETAHPQYPEYWELDQEFLTAYLESEGFTYLGSGRHRRTFLSPNRRFVLKFPRDLYGLEANQKECKTWKKAVRGEWRSQHGEALAPARLICDAICVMPAMTELYGRTRGCGKARVILSNGQMDDDPEPEDMEKSLPAWLDNYYVDCAQVGKMRNGKVVVYDYGG